MSHAFVILSALCKQGGNVGVFEQHMQRGATVIPCNTVKSSFCIADTESLQSTNNEQQRNGLGVAWLDLGHGKRRTAQLELSVGWHMCPALSPGYLYVEVQVFENSRWFSIKCTSGSHPLCMLETRSLFELLSRNLSLNKMMGSCLPPNTVKLSYNFLSPVFFFFFAILLFCMLRYHISLICKSHSSMFIQIQMQTSKTLYVFHTDAALFASLHRGIA